MKEKIYLNRNEELLDQVRRLQQSQSEFDRKKKKYRELGSEVRSMGQKIPEMIKKLKCNVKPRY